MTTQQQIDDPGQWRVGDVFEGTYCGDAMSGMLRVEDGAFKPGVLLIGGTIVRKANGELPTYITGHVTRTVEPIPEPTVPWALVRFADDEVMYRDPTSKSSPWVETSSGEADRYTWNNAKEVYGAPVAVSLPHWSDEVDGPGIETVRKSADEWWTLYSEELAAHKALRAAVAKMLDELPLIVSGIYHDLELSPMGRGGTLHHEPDATPGSGACPGDNLTAWFDRLRALLAQGGEA